MADHVRLKDIAEAANVSVSCVERYLNQSGYVSAEKRGRIEDAIKETGYIPNRTARTLRGQKSKLIGHIRTYAEDNRMFNKLAMELDNQAYQMGYLVIDMVYKQEDGIQELKNKITALLGYQVDAIIFSCCVDTKYTGDIQHILYDFLSRLPIPVIMMERAFDIYSVNKVFVDYKEGSFNATKKLIEAGHKDIAYLGKKTDLPVEKERLQGFLEAMEAENLPVNREKRLILVDDYHIQDGCMGMEKFLETEPYPTAIFTASDIFASAAVRTLTKHKLRIPDDMSIVGYDDTYAEVLTPPISTMRLPFQEMVRNALKIVAENGKNGEKKSGQTIIISPEYIERESVKRIS